MDDGNQPVVPEVQTTPNKKLFNILEVGFFEIAFVLGTILIIFLGLNFFRILRLEASFPFLSFLPHLSSGSVNKVQDTNIYAKYLTPTATPTPPIDKATLDELSNSVTQNVQENYASPISSSQVTTNYSDKTTLFSWQKSIGNNEVSGTIIIKKDNGTYDKTIYITTVTNFTIPITDAQAIQLVNTYFINPQISAWQCSENGSHSVCSSEITSANEKIMFTVNADKSLPNIIFIHECIAGASTLNKQGNYCLL